MQQVKKVKGYLRFSTMAECWWRMSLHTAPRETAAAPRSHYNLRRDHKTLVCTHVPPRNTKSKVIWGFLFIFSLLATHRNDYFTTWCYWKLPQMKNDNDCFVKFEQRVEKVPTHELTDRPLGTVLSGGFSWVWFLSNVMATAVTATWETVRNCQCEKVLHFSIHSFVL